MRIKRVQMQESGQKNTTSAPATGHDVNFTVLKCRHINNSRVHYIDFDYNGSLQALNLILSTKVNCVRTTKYTTIVLLRYNTRRKKEEEEEEDTRPAPTRVLIVTDPGRIIAVPIPTASNMLCFGTCDHRNITQRVKDHGGAQVDKCTFPSRRTITRALTAGSCILL